GPHVKVGAGIVHEHRGLVARSVPHRLDELRVVCKDWLRRGDRREPVFVRTFVGLPAAGRDDKGGYRTPLQVPSHTRALRWENGSGSRWRRARALREI